MASRKNGESPSGVAVVKKYANRRLYNTASSSYVTLDELSQMVRDGEDFVVYDAKSGEDITRSVLTQIIMEEDSKGRNLLPISFLRQVIGYYDDQLHALLPRYLELSMENFARNQDQIRSYVEDTFGRFFPLGQFEDMARQNMAILSKAAHMWQPFPDEGSPNGAAGAAGDAAASMKRPEPGSPRTMVDRSDRDEKLSGEMRDLRAQVEALQKQLAAMVRETGAKD